MHQQYEPGLNTQQMKWRWLALPLAGAMSALALPPVGAWPLLVAGFFMLQFLLERGRQRRRDWFWQGLVFGLGYFVAALHWIGFAFLVDAKDYLWMMPFAVLGLSCVMALYWGLAMVLARQLVTWRVPLYVALPSALYAAEFLRGRLFTGFPWAAPGLAADGMGPVLQLASLMGMEGLTFLILVWALLPAALWQAWRRLQGRAAALVPVALFACLLPAAGLWGHWRLQMNPTQSTDHVVVRLVQPNISQSDKWRSDNAVAIFNALMNYSSQTASRQPTVIVWPESSLPFLLDESDAGLSRIAAMLGPARTLVAGAIRRQKSGEGEDYFTSMLVIDGMGQVRDRYDKWRLVPGGEFLPLAWALEPLGFRKVVTVPESFTPGSGPRSVPVPGLGLAGMLICYEAIFPDHLIDATQRPRLLINVTNDGWFGQSVGPYQHLAQVRMRAVEQGLAVARSANTGISAVIDPVGRIVAASQLGAGTIVDADIPDSLESTVFSLWGAWVSVLMVVTVLFFSAVLNRFT